MPHRTGSRLGHWRLRCYGPLLWSAGRLGCCGVWAYRTPWGALYGARQRHRNRIRPVTPEVRQWAEDLSAQIDQAREAGFRFVTIEEGQPWREKTKVSTGPIILHME